MYNEFIHSILRRKRLFEYIVFLIFNLNIFVAAIKIDLQSKFLFFIPKIF